METTNHNIERKAPEDAYILSYDNPYSQELIRKLNERFMGTEATFPLFEEGEVYGGDMVRRAGIETILATDPNLKNLHIKPITPLDSELLLQERRLPKGGYFYESLGLILYDTSGINSKEARALYKNLGENLESLDITNSILRDRLLIVRPGLEKDPTMPYGIKFVVIPGLTKVYSPDVLNYDGEHSFEYGLDQGLPHVEGLDIGNRTICLPTKESKIGLNVLSKKHNLELDVTEVISNDKLVNLYNSITLAKYK
ncbi:MAG TPA: hypothetical protein VJJ23_01190 [Candidatus Nanoarchaeia archaeon]|nr:hypothetical protein [Candidatus Nanoarchaeia archaeon]